MNKTAVMSLTLLAAVGINGCSTRDKLAAEEVLKHGNCQTLESGISQVSFEDVAKIRGSKLIGMTDLEQPQQEPDLLLLAVSNGDQPTPGYGFNLKDAYLDGETAIIEFSWTVPEADAILAQVMTHPCIVVGLGTGSFRLIRAIDHTGKLIGELSL